MSYKTANAGRIRCLLIGLTVGSLLACYATKWSGVWCDHDTDTGISHHYFSPGE